MENESKVRKLKVFDTTLIDAEKNSRDPLRVDEKLVLAKRIDKVGVDVIEAGFPKSSNAEKTAVRIIATDGLDAEVCAIARPRKNEIRILEDMGINYVHLYFPSSDYFLRKNFGIRQKDALKEINELISFSKMHKMKVEFSAQDATRTDMDFLKIFCRVAELAGADRINIDDTTSYAIPEDIHKIIYEIKTIINLPLSISCHNHFGLAVENTISGIKAGAECAHLSIKGLGEEIGNASLEGVISYIEFLNTENEIFTIINLNEVYTTSKLISELHGTR
ncbi:MAG: hypothetical protein ACP5M9_01280 [Candidatus Micrarchaeia archaeon]